MTRLRAYQTQGKADIFAEWAKGHRNVLFKSPTGSGKTVLFADVVRTVDCAAAVIAHRKELVSQMSLALAREGVRHRVIGPDNLRRNCVALHMDRLGRSFYDPGARVGVCGVDTLVNKDAAKDPWFTQVGLWVMDEAHHVLRENKWGRAVEMFPNAQGLGVTATPARADGKGLGRDADGAMDVMVYGPEMRDLIDWGYLTPYKIFTPPSDVDYSQVTVTATGDYSPVKLRAAVHASDAIVGDVVQQYLKIARGKLGITFAVDVEAAQDLAQGYRAAGVPAEVITAETPDLLRSAILRRFERREVLQLVNVDLFGEGFDLPAIEVVSMVRKTESWPLFVQQFGRALRLMVAPELAARWEDFTPEQRRAHIAASGKPHALIIDHVGNVFRHGVPDAPRFDTLDARERRSTGPSDAIPTRICPNNKVGGVENQACGRTYERALKCCPYCGHTPEPASRSAPEYVDGDLFELDPAVLAAMRGEVARIDGAPRIPQGLSAPAAANVVKQHNERFRAQQELRTVLNLWGGWQQAQGHDLSYAWRLFFLTFGIDTLSAQALGRADAQALMQRVQKVLDENGVIAQ